MSTLSRIARAPLARRAAAVNRGTRRGGFIRLAGGLAIRLADLLYLWQRRLRDRDTLRQMSTTQLKDIGLSRADALNEADKPFWRA